MSRILCIWEQGSNLGHLATLRLPIEIALQGGADVFLAARELDRARSVLGDRPLRYLQAPFKQHVQPADRSSYLGYAHLLAHDCFSSAEELGMYLRAWQTLFDLVQPDLVLFEHSPTALIASQACRFKKVLIGTGFFIPPLPMTPAAPFAPFAPFATTAQTPAAIKGLVADDAVVLTVINLALAGLGQPALPHLGAIYAQADASFMMTLPMLDHFGERVGQRYLGHAPAGPQPAPQWPDSDGPKVYGYLQNFASLEALLKDLQRARVCALLVVHGLPAHLRSAYTSERLHFCDHLVDLNAVAQQANAVIHHGNHNTLADFAHAGVVQLVIPRHQEQLLVCLRLMASGGAVMAYQDQAGFAAELAKVLTDPALAEGARALQLLCRPFDVQSAAHYIRTTLQGLLPSQVLARF